MQMNQSQHKAVLHKDGPMLVLAGPGSGKTLVITERTRHLIEQYHIPEDKILVITFTKAAANEMKERFLKMMKLSHTRVNFGTFHAVFFTILKVAYHLNSNNIVREEIKLQLLREIIHRMHLEYEDEKEFISDLVSEISLVKGNRINISNYYSAACPDEIFRKIYIDYDRSLRKSNLIDFDDMLVLSHQLLSQRKDILKLWQDKFQYILIDEFQDINMVQYEVIRMLAAPRNNLFVVGDDDQSIYRFRGAKPEIMLNFPKDYPECKQILLNVNYRSTANIVEAANMLIMHNENRFPKKVHTVKEKGPQVTLHQYETLSLENQGLVNDILMKNKAGIPLSDMAILIRTNSGSGALVHKLMEYNISFKIRDGLPNIYEHWIALDIISYIKISMGQCDRRLFLQIINRPKRYISRDCFDTPQVDLDGVKDYYEDKYWMLERIDQLEYDLALLSDMTPFAAVNYIRRGIGYEDYLREYAEQRRIKLEDLIDLLDELQEDARPFQNYESWFAHMEEYKEELKKQFENDNKDNDSITIATMHSSKGLEFKVVYIMDASEGITPHKKAVLPADIEEERRLFYVAMTRAKEYLVILNAKERYNKVMQRSRFIEEIISKQRER